MKCSAAGRSASRPAVRSVSRSAFTVAVCIAVGSAVSGCAWFTDFKQQPKLDPWETPADTIPMRANPQFSVPVYGSAAPGFAF